MMKIGGDIMSQDIDNTDKEGLKKVRYCSHCLGLEPCWCGNPEYISTWDFVYNAFKNLKMGS